MGLAGIDLNLLIALDALLTECNVTRAARRTSVGQPAMSASLARLRKHFDDPLLVKEGRRLMRTPLAEALVSPVREALTAVESVMLRSSAFDPKTDRAAFSIVAADYVTMVLLRPLLGMIADEAPYVRISVRQVDVNFADQLRRGDVDMVIVPTELTGERLAFPCEQLFTDRFVLVVDRNHPDIGDEVTLDELTSLRYVAYSGGAVTPIADADLAALGVHLQVEVTTQGFVVVPFLITGTRLASLALERLARLLADAAGVRIVECPLSERSIHEVLYWNPRHTDDPAHQWLRSRIIRFARSLRHPTAPFVT
ncbi:LysR family transcriptional regulator [Plantactinospora sp. GCM10030261]|uniref:LysR family transcriptional regulator n=1 Tax=Plantactinospora sp. GCM10030261 TaxID=3273420 RepID=UPI003608BDC8